VQELHHKGEWFMTIEALIIWIAIGAIAGWLAGLIVKGYGFGLIGNLTTTAEGLNKIGRQPMPY
jgi:hypothetical protein